MFADALPLERVGFLLETARRQMRGLDVELGDALPAERRRNQTSQLEQPLNRGRKGVQIELRIGRGQWTVLAVLDGRGDCPVLDLLESSGAPGVRLLADLQERVPQYGPLLNSEASKPLRDKILEFREPTSSGGTLRVLYFYDKGHVVVCANGVLKKSRKTPDDLIDAAVALRAQYYAGKLRNDIEMEDLPAEDAEEE